MKFSNLFFSSTLNISCSVEASEFHLLSPFLSGQSVAGILAAVANIISISFSPNIYWEVEVLNKI